ncbi:MAG: M14 family metallopeptidase [Planctomycetota bacterium]
MEDSYFSADYDTARRRFRESARRLDADLVSHPVLARDHDSLTIDVVTVGPETGPVVIISSGVHGVEGFLGSAIQLALLDQLRAEKRLSARYVLVHAVNPFGFAERRRFNEDGVDLNRNFLAGGEMYRGAADAYRLFDSFLNPKSAPKREFFTAKCLWLIWRHGLDTLKQAVAQGQYEYPSGLFFGGHESSTSMEIVSEYCDRWLGVAQRAILIDIHSGLGKFGGYKILVNERPDSSTLSWYNSTFDEEAVETLIEPDGTAYSASGLFTDWMNQRFADRDFRSIGLEFGTYNVIRVLAAIRAENRAHLYGDPNTKSYRSAKEELLECFCPRSATWRHRVVHAGMSVIAQAADKLCSLGTSRAKRSVEVG